MITRQRGNTQTSDSGDSPESLDPDNERTIKELESAILSLEQRIQQFSHSKNQVENESLVPSLESVTEEIHELEQLVKENEILSGLTISETSCSVLEQDLRSSERQHTVVGEAGGMQFKLQYDVREQLNKGSPGEPSAEVTVLEMDVRDDMVEQLRTDLFNVAADVSVRELFQLLSSYGFWVEDRERAINHFSSSFPEVVEREDLNDPGSNINMVICDPEKRIKLRIVWGLRVLPMRCVMPDLQLQVEAAPEVVAKDLNGTLSSAPEIFQLMLKKFGVESAIQMLVKLVDSVPS